MRPQCHHAAPRALSGATAATPRLRSLDSPPSGSACWRALTSSSGPPRRARQLQSSRASLLQSVSPFVSQKPLHVRWATTSRTGEQPYEAVVVGAGPAGITCVGNLLERKLPGPILWVDDGFDGGRVNRKYREVPSNTKVGLFIDFATALEPFRRIVGERASGEVLGAAGEGKDLAGKEDKLKALRELDPQKGCKLSYAADMCLMLTEGLKKTEGVHTTQDRLVEAVLDEGTQQWGVRIGDSSTQLQTKRLVLCTGASPNDTPLPTQNPQTKPLHLDTALSPTLLSQTLPTSTPTIVAVIGASHSAILVLMNLVHLASTTHPSLRIRWLTRHPLRYAEYRDGWILRDNTGLKGDAAAWAKSNLEPAVLDASPVSQFVEKVSYTAGDEAQTFATHLDGAHHYVQAIGYRADTHPRLRTSGGSEVTPLFDHETGAFSYDRGAAAKEGSSVGKGEKVIRRLPGLFGAGIAWPERVRDPEGNVEYAVGFFKFMKFCRRVVPAWN